MKSGHYLVKWLLRRDHLKVLTATTLIKMDNGPLTILQAPQKPLCSGGLPFEYNAAYQFQGHQPLSS